MKFFNESDFNTLKSKGHFTWEEIADLANAKLEKESRIVFTSLDPNDSWTTWGYDIDGPRTFHALLINIEPIEKCSHPKEKISGRYADENGVVFKCECGARVSPCQFSEVKE